MSRTYPYRAWMLQPSFKPVEVEVTEGHRYGRSDYEQLASGRSVHVTELHASKDAAIAHGRAALVRQQADLDKKTANLAKRKAALDKAEG